MTKPVSPRNDLRIDRCQKSVRRKMNPKTEIEPRMARKGTDEERVMETFSNLFGVFLNP
jgi:hypothetical protein